MPLRQARLAGLVVLLLTAGWVGCDTVRPSPSPSDGPSSTPSPSETGPKGGLDLSPLGWYQVERLANTHGDETRTLFAGSLDGTLTTQLPLSSARKQDPQDVRTRFELIGRQAAGIFGNRVLIWERTGGLGAIEVVDIHDGSLESIVGEVPGLVHAATADQDLVSVYFITIGAQGDPEGLWRLRTRDHAGPKQIPFEFAGGRNDYRLIANDDGSWLGVESDGSSATFIHAESGLSIERRSGGPVIAIEGRTVLTYGPQDDSGTRDVLAFELPGGNSRRIAEEVNTAQLALASSGEPVCVVMRIDPLDVRTFTISAVELSLPGEHVVYTQGTEELGSMLPSLDEVPLSTEQHPGWVVLVDTFLQYIEREPAAALGDPALAPRLLSIAAGEPIPLGPFAPP